MTGEAAHAPGTSGAIGADGANPTGAATALRLDQALVERGLVRSRNRAAREIDAGRVRVDGTVVRKPAFRVPPEAVLVLEDEDPWVARSAHKLLGALTDLPGPAERLADAVCLDAGASTGGFTQVLLARGAAHVYAVDVGHDQLAAELRSDSRVTNLEGHNLRALHPAWIAPHTGVDLVVADVSFISLTHFTDRLLGIVRPGGELLLMVKPQFELARSALDKHGVVTSPVRRAEAVAHVARDLTSRGGEILGWAPSRLPGPTGNREYFLHVRRPRGGVVSDPATDLVARMTESIGRESA